MCGRFHIDISEPEWRDIIEAAMRRAPDAAIKQGEVRPTDSAPVIALAGEKSTAELMSWGYAKPAGAKGVIINARAETVRERPLFGGDFGARRCVVPANAFWEWSRDKTKFVCRKPQGLLYLGGLWRLRGGRREFVILTKEATPPVAAIHDRIPVILDREEISAWLRDADFAEAAIKRPYAQALLAARA